MKELIAEIQADIAEIEATEIHVETNQGTYTGGDPRLNNREVYETVGGVRREVGPGEEDAPGRMRRINAAQMKALRKQAKALRGRLAALRKESAK